jgi:hypothetical protein
VCLTKNKKNNELKQKNMYHRISHFNLLINLIFEFFSYICIMFYFLIADSNIPKIKDHIKNALNQKMAKILQKILKWPHVFSLKNTKLSLKNTKFTTPNITKGP